MKPINTFKKDPRAWAGISLFELKIKGMIGAKEFSRDVHTKIHGRWIGNMYVRKRFLSCSNAIVYYIKIKSSIFVYLRFKS